MTALRAGLLGLGGIGRHHARVLASTPGLELVGVADPAGDRHSAAKSIPVHKSLEDLLSIGLDLCVVASPTPTHEDLCLRLAAAGVATLVEKPLATDPKAARRIVDAFESSGTCSAVGHVERFNPAIRQLRSRLDRNELGDIYQVATRRQGPFPTRIGDTGVIVDLASHDIDLTRWITGQQFATVSAGTAARSESGSEDLVVFMGRLEDGTVTSHLVNWLSPLKERVTVVTGEHGCFTANTLTAGLTFHANGNSKLDWDAITHFRGVSEGDVVSYAFPKPEPIRTEIENFRDAVLGSWAETVSLREGLAVVEVAEAVQRSAAEGKTVEVSYHYSE